MAFSPFSPHLFLAFFISSLPFGGRDPLDHRRSPVDIPSVSAVASTLTGPRPTIYGMSGGRTSGLLLSCWTHSSEGSTNMPMLRLTQHSLARFMWVVPYSQYVSLAVEQQCRPAEQESGVGGRLKLRFPWDSLAGRVSPLA